MTGTRWQAGLAGHCCSAIRPGPAANRNQLGTQDCPSSLATSKQTIEATATICCPKWVGMHAQCSFVSAQGKASHGSQKGKASLPRRRRSMRPFCTKHWASHQGSLHHAGWRSYEQQKSKRQQAERQASNGVPTRARLARHAHCASHACACCLAYPAWA